MLFHELHEEIKKKQQKRKDFCQNLDPLILLHHSLDLMIFILLTQTLAPKMLPSDASLTPTVYDFCSRQT